MLARENVCNLTLNVNGLGNIGNIFCCHHTNIEIENYSNIIKKQHSMRQDCNLSQAKIPEGRTGRTKRAAVTSGKGPQIKISNGIREKKINYFVS